MLKYKIVDENNETIYEGFAEHVSQLISAIVGYDDVHKTWMPISVTDRGLSKTANYVWNPDTLAWETAIGSASDGQSISQQNYTVRIDEVGVVTYIGKAAIGSLETDAVWQIQKIDETLGTVITWADGNAIFDNKWSEHLIKDYS